MRASPIRPYVKCAKSLNKFTSLQHKSRKSILFNHKSWWNSQIEMTFI